MADELFRLRPAVEDDLPALCALSRGEGMDDIPGIEGVTVAESNVGDIVGFVRLVVGPANGIAHVEPIVTYPTWQGYGVGRALMEHALEERGEIRLVSRGTSTPFYQRLGYEPCEWDMIDTSVTEDCIGCPHWDECQPVPMVKTI